MLDQRNPSFELSITYTREVLRKSYELLRVSTPDTFVGRKTQELSPPKYEHSDIERWDRATI